MDMMPRSSMLGALVDFFAEGRSRSGRAYARAAAIEFDDHAHGDIRCR